LFFTGLGPEMGLPHKDMPGLNSQARHAKLVLPALQLAIDQKP
jgi:hypothetical protein